MTEKTISHYKILEKLGSKSPPFVHMWALYSQAECHLRAGDLEVAVNALEKLQGLFDYRYDVRAVYYPKSFYLIGKIREKQGMPQRAVKNYEKFLELWNDADKDLPNLLDAKARLAESQRTSKK